MRLKKIYRLISVLIVMSLFAFIWVVTPVEAATGSITIYPTTGQIGTNVTITGSLFTGTNYHIFFDGNPVLVGTVTAGGFSTSYTIPSKPRGSYPFRATTDAPDDSNTPNFIVTPSLSLSPSSGVIGDSIFVSGTGFATGSVALFFDTSTMGSTSADNTGVLSGAYVTVPQAVRGNHQIRATDNTGITFQSSFNINSKISVTPVTASVGSTITISGTGFVANAQPTFYLDDVVFPAVGTGDNFGNIQATVIVPAVSGGNHSLKVQDSGSSATASLSVTAIISLTPSNGAANSPVTVTGKGFGANKPVTLTWKGLPISSNPASLSSDNNGAFTATVTAPVGQAGSYTISASDGTLSASADFSMTASITPSVSTGEVGGNITIGGIGFNPSAPVTIKFDNVQIATAIADTTGAFSTTIVVPPSIAGSHTITASDTIITTSPINISVTSSTSLSIVSGYVGSDITVKGSGFSAGSAGKTVTIKYDDIFNTTTTSDTSGSFSITFKAPASKGGNHTITATDGTYTTKNNYAMDSTLPPVPANLLPENKSNADALTKFTWAPSNDPSGVTYELQVATEAGFGALIVDKKDLATPGYQTTEAEKFKTTGGDAPYYWRVRAIDGAGNASDWTNPQTFSVGFIFPTWGIYVIFVLLIVLAAGGGFWFGRRTSFKWDW